MSKYSKAIGATVGAVVAWGAVLGLESLANINVDAVTTAIVALGGIVGAFFSPKNA